MQRPAGTRIGVAGRTRADWSPLFPVESDDERLAALAAMFGLVEFDTTRFAVPAVRTVQRWSDALLAGSKESGTDATHRVLATVQVPCELLEHEPPDPATVDAFRSALRPLDRRRQLGALVARFDDELLHGPSEVRRVARVAFDLDGLPLVVDLRHPSWRDPRALDALAGAGVSLAQLDRGIGLEPLALTGPLGLLRLEGGAEPLYPPPAIGELARRIERLGERTDLALAVAANARGGAALANALELCWLLGGRRPIEPWPALLARFPHLAVVRG